MPHLVSVVAEAGHGAVGVHAIGSVSLGFIFIQGLHHILNPPKFFLNADVLLAGRLRLKGNRKSTFRHFTWRSGHREEQSGERNMYYLLLSDNRFVQKRRALQKGKP